MKTYLFGAAGAGITTLDKALVQQLSVSYFDTDTYVGCLPSRSLRSGGSRALDSHTHWLGHVTYPVLKLRSVPVVPERVAQAPTNIRTFGEAR